MNKSSNLGSFLPLLSPPEQKRKKKENNEAEIGAEKDEEFEQGQVVKELPPRGDR